MNITFLGAAQTVTGSCFLLEGAGDKVLIDCGMFQGGASLEELNRDDFAFNPAELAHVVLTHAHIDHTGRLPKLVKDGFRGKIYSTEPTRSLCEIMLLDSAHIQQTDAEYTSKKNARKGLPPQEPLYTEEDVEETMKLFIDFAYDKIIELTPNIKIRFIDAGHMLGSSYVEIWVTEDGKTQKVLFSGDIGNINKPILNNPKYVDEADYVICESTYGGRCHTCKRDSEDLLSIIIDTMREKGTLVIPSFAVGRTQEILYDINHYKENDMLGQYSDVRVLVDSPLAIKATEVFKKYYGLFDEDAQRLIAQGDDPLMFPNLEYSLTTDDSKAINADDSPKIIISASGMADAGRVRHHIKHNIYKPNCTILFAGYQAEGSLGRMLLDGASDIKLFGERIAVNAKIKVIDYYSGHADHNALIDWIDHIKGKKKVILVHGEAEAGQALSEELVKRGVNVEIAKFMSVIDLDCGCTLNEGSALPTEEDYYRTLSEKALKLSDKLKEKENLLNLVDIDKIKLFLDTIDDIITSE